MLATIAVIWFAIGFQLSLHRAQAVRQASEVSADLARAADEDISRALQSLDRTMFALRAAYAQDPVHFSLADWLRLAHAQDDLTLQIAIIGRDGKLLATSLGPVTRAVDLGDRPHFRATMEAPGDALFISKPVRGHLSGKWTVQLTRKLFAPDGTVAGVVVLSLDPSYLTRLFEQLEMGHGSLALVGTDGVVRARAPDGVATIGQHLPPGGLEQDTGGKDQGTFRSASRIDGAERIFSFRRQENYPLVVVVGLDMKGVMAGYRQDRRSYLVAGGVLSVLVLLLGGVLARHQRKLELSRQVLTGAVENISQGLMMIGPDMRVALINRRAAELLGLPERFLAERASFAEMFEWQKAAGEFPAETGPESALVRNLREAATGRVQSVYERTRPNGTVLEIATRVLPSGGAVRTFTDITERKRAEARIAYLAHHDGLTGLANRTLLHERLAQAVARARADADPVAVLCLDLDRFKQVNDRFGHDTGDALLVQVADRLRGAVRPVDMVGRVGGDEFVVVQSGGNQPAAAAQLARRIIGVLAEPFQIGTQSLVTATSIGIALSGMDGDACGPLLKNADIALYRAKAAGRGVYRFFEREMDERLHETRRLEHELRDAIGTEQIHLLFQPQLRAETLEVTGFEALVRWEHPHHGMLLPADFISLAEKTGLIVPLGAWILEAACATAASWPDACRIAVNVSPLQLEEGDLPRLAADVLGRTGLPPERLELEVTESIVMRDTEQVLRQVQALKALGVQFAIDDFGAGYSSLSYLRRFPFDRLKIDRSFVQAIEADPAARAIVQAILRMSRGLALAVTAEGVETHAQRSFLHAERCDDLQGMLLGHPMPAASVATFLGELRASRDADSAAA